MNVCPVCKHDPPRCSESFEHGRDCRLCWNYNFDRRYRVLWGGDGSGMRELKVVKKVRFNSPPGGPGTELTKLFSTIGIRPIEGCKCKQRSCEMDRNGPQWCRDNIDIIIGWLREEAERQGTPRLPGFNFVARQIVLKAIEKAEVAHSSG